MAGDDYTRYRFDWWDQVLADHELPATAFKVAYVIGWHLNRGTGEAFPTQKTIARLVGIDVRSVRNLTDRLQLRGHLEATESRGRGDVIRYRPVLEKRNADSALPAEKAEPTFLFMEEESGKSAQEKRKFHAQESGTQVPPEPLDRKPSDQPLEGVSLSPAKSSGGKKAGRRESEELESDFAAFWIQFPRKVARGNAHAAYIKARRAGATAEDLLAGAMRYSAERTGQDAKYTKHPATWLHGQCWADESPATSPPLSVGSTAVVPIDHQTSEIEQQLAAQFPGGDIPNAFRDAFGLTRRGRR